MVRVLFLNAGLRNPLDSVIYLQRLIDHVRLRRLNDHDLLLLQLGLLYYLDFFWRLVDDPLRIDDRLQAENVMSER